jgi:penicillin amidase
VAQVKGILEVEGLSAPVAIVRDRWGVPHIRASTQDDLFFAQGFVQAQDRLFQMDLWRRAAQGRLAEVLGANFILRDVMTRRMQYRGDMTAEWASYGPDTQAIAAAFVNGINAWVAQARAQLPEEFIFAGWAPELWQPEDLLNRTEAFVASGNALDEIFRVQLASALGVEQVDRLLPPRSGRASTAPRGLDLSLVSPIVSDGLRRVGTEPFFMGLAVRPGGEASGRSAAGGSNAWAVGPSRTESGAALLAADPHQWLAHPSLRYLVHLRAPGWHVAGATAPWRPGVVIGHNDRLAWGMTAAHLDTQDIYIERVHPDDPRQVSVEGVWVQSEVDTGVIVVKGRDEPFEFDRQVTPHGVVVAVDPDRQLAYTVRWSGFEPGTAAELAALSLNRAQSWSEFNDALRQWKMPAAEFVYADIDGHVARQVAGLSPVRNGWNGALPVPGWSGEFEWQGWTPPEGLLHSADPSSGFVISANDSPARSSRIQDVLAGDPSATVDTLKALQYDTLSWNASRLVPLLEGLSPDRGDLEHVRALLMEWDRRMDGSSDAALLYLRWERALMDRLIRLRVPARLANQAAERAQNALVPALVDPSPTWFDGDPTTARDALLMTALEETVTVGPVQHEATFTHPLAVTEAFRSRFNVGPFSLPGASDTVLSVSPSGNRTIGPSFRMIADLHDWDRSVVTNVPGQSGSPYSEHFRDLAEMWAAGEYFPLSFSDASVSQNAEATLTLLPPAPAASIQNTEP